jgi:hypothetical protein
LSNGLIQLERGQIRGRLGPVDSTPHSPASGPHECVWTGARLANSWRHFEIARAAPSNWADGERAPEDRSTCLGRDSVRPCNPAAIPSPPLRPAQPRAARWGSAGDGRRRFGPLIDDVFTFKDIDAYGFGAIDGRSRRRSDPGAPSRGSRPNGPLAQASHVVGLPLRPLVEHVRPSAPAQHSATSTLSTRTSGRPSEWNHGASQDEWGRRSVLDIDLFDRASGPRGQADHRVGKTELFGTGPVQPRRFRPASLPSLGTAEISLWSARAIWSFYDVARSRTCASSWR